jgi:hypothetical protein
VRPSWRAFFKPRPALSLPAADRLLVALPRLAGWSSATPVELAQDTPDLRRVVAPAVLLLDEFADPRQGPQSGKVAELLGSPFQALFEPSQLVVAELRPPSRASGPTQPITAGGVQGLGPTVDRLAVYSQPTCHLGF